MAPEPGVPPDSRAQRYYVALDERFVKGMTQEETADRLHLSVRQLQRVQKEAVLLLARRLEEHRTRPARLPDGDRRAHVGPAVRGQASDWDKQAEMELAALRTSSPESVADVQQTVLGVLELAEVVASRHHVRIRVGSIPSGLAAAVNPTALRQTLITAIGRLVPLISPGEIRVYATLADAKVRVTLTGSLTTTAHLDIDELVRDIITPPGASVEARLRGTRVFLRVRAPSALQRTVVVVEDNPDMVHLYRRSTAGTAYRIVHAPPSEDLVPAIEAAAPDAIVLDVMLPHIDGWQLLTHLYERPSTRSIPIIVCSVVKERELALALGASLFIPKPIRPTQFIAALDQVVPRAPGGP
jgi:CheY-like chemotaxis protein